MTQLQNASKRLESVEFLGLDKMADEDFLSFTTQVIDQFLTTITEFIEWWSNLMSELASIEGLMKCLNGDSGPKKIVLRSWKSIESEYRTYKADVSGSHFELRNPGLGTPLGHGTTRLL